MSQRDDFEPEVLEDHITWGVRDARCAACIRVVGEPAPDWDPAEGS